MNKNKLVLFCGLFQVLKNGTQKLKNCIPNLKKWYTKIKKMCTQKLK